MTILNLSKSPTVKLLFLLVSGLVGLVDAERGKNISITIHEKRTYRIHTT